MYWYLQKPEDRPLYLSKQILKLSNTYVCKDCKNDLSVVVLKNENRRKTLWCKRCNGERSYADSKTKFSLLKDDEKIKIAKEAQQWSLEPGKNFYEPNEKEYWYFLQPHMIKGISGGNRSGKTCTCTIDYIMQCEGWHPLQKENLIKLSVEAIDDKVREWCKKILNEGRWIASPPVHGRVVAVDFPNGVEKFTGPEYEKWLSKKEIETIAYDNEKKRIIRWKNGSFVEFMSQDQELDAHGGSARDFVHCDEELPKEYWTENMMRIISKRGRMSLGATAINGVTWTENDIWKPGESGNEDIYTIEMSTYDNPVNTIDIIEKIKKQCRDQVEIDIRIYGKRTLRGGHVYKMYMEREPHVIEVEAA